MSGVGISGMIKDLPGTITPYPVWEDVDGLGGWMSVPDAAARDALPDNYRKIGRVVVCQDTGIAYQLAHGITNADYVQITFPAFLSVSRISTGNTGGTKLVDIVTTGLTTGQLATVSSVGAVFELVTSAPSALIAQADGITIVQSTATPTSVWTRTTVVNLKFGSTPPLFIDPIAWSVDTELTTSEFVG